jgi:hypothetical protein
MNLFDSETGDFLERKMETHRVGVRMGARQEGR